MSDGPDRVDIHVGQRMRARRLEMGLAQGALADALGVSFQQVQKYERGTNRVSASMLHRAALFQGVPPAYYFEGLPESGASVLTDQAAAADWLTTKEAWAFAEVLPRLSAPQRAAVLQFARGVLGKPDRP